jgi:hypothetical protein
MKRKDLLLAMVLGLVMLLAFSASAVSPPTWIKDSVNGEDPATKMTLFTWEWASPILQLEGGSVSMGIRVYYTDYGRQVRELPNVKEVLYIVQMNLSTNQYRFYSIDHWDFNNNKIYSSEEFPNGEEWLTPKPGSMAERWMEVARTAPKSR